MISSFLIDFVLSSIFFIKLLIATDEACNLIIAIIASTFKAFILANEFGDMSVTFMNLHFKSINILPELGDGPSIDISFSSDLE